MPWCQKVREARYRVTDGSTGAVGEGPTASDAWEAFRESSRRRAAELEARDEPTERDERELAVLRARGASP